jgi:hypothetical protein
MAYSHVYTRRSWIGVRSDGREETIAHEAIPHSDGGRHVQRLLAEYRARTNHGGHRSDAYFVETTRPRLQERYSTCHYSDPVVYDVRPPDRSRFRRSRGKKYYDEPSRDREIVIGLEKDKKKKKKRQEKPRSAREQPATTREPMRFVGREMPRQSSSTDKHRQSSTSQTTRYEVPVEGYATVAVNPGRLDRFHIEGYHIRPKGVSGWPYLSAMPPSGDVTASGKKR